MRVLLAEDETRIAEDIAAVLQSSGYVVDVADNGEDAWFMGGTQDYAAVILDLGLPEIDGVTVLTRWRQQGVHLPVLVLTARGSWAERVEGIDAGADDYLAKPFHMEELLARLRALVRRSAGQSAPLISHGALTLDTRQMRVNIDGRPVNLTPLEYRLVSYLLHHRGRVVSQMELTEHIYAQDFERDSNAIEVLVGRVRRKLKIDLIETRRGFGYTVPEEAA